MYYSWYLLFYLLVFALHIWMLLCWVHRYLYVLYPLVGLLLCNILLSLLLEFCYKISSDISIATPAFFSDLFAWNIFFLSLHCLCVSLDLKWISCRHYFKKQEKSQIHNLTLHLKEVEKEWQYLWVFFFFHSFGYFVFLLEHLVYLHLNWLLIGMSLVPFCELFSGCFVVLICSFLLLFSHLVIWWLPLVLFLYSLVLCGKFLFCG